MNNEKLNHWLSFAANVGVIAGIVFLAIEINQNTAISRAQTRAQQTASVLTLQQMERHPDLLAAYEKVATGRSLTFRDRFVLAIQANADFRHWENSYYQYRAGLFEDQEFRAEADAISNLLSEQNHWQYWACQRNAYSADFRAFVDGLGEIPPCPDSNVLDALANPYVLEDQE